MADMRVVGVFSGLDTQSIIDKLMSLERKPIELLQQKEAKLEQQKTAWQKIGQDLNALNAVLFDLTLSSTFAAKTATSSNTSVLTAQASSTAQPGTYNIVVTQLAQAQSVASDAYSSPTLRLGDLINGFSGGTFEINGKPITVTADDSLNSVATKINDAKAGVTATVVQQGPGSYLLVITSQATGETTGKITFQEPVNGVLEQLGVLVRDSNNNLVPNHQLVAPQDAKFTVNNLPLTRSSNTVTDAIPGVTLQLQGADSTKTVTLSIATDVQAIVGKIKNFVDKYNALMQDIADYTKYDPNTKTAGILMGDASLYQLQSSLRRWISDFVSNLPYPYNSLSGIGIATSGEAPTLSIDETKLSQALSQAPDNVAQLFSQNSGSASPSQADGVAVRLKKVLNLWLTGTGTTGVGFLQAKDNYFSQEIRSIEDQIRYIEDRLKIRERVLWQQFNAMEEYLARLNAQSNWLAQKFAQLNKQ